MSYIRCLSNPERLYVFDDDRGICVIHSVRPPLASPNKDKLAPAMFHVPVKAFHDVCLRWEMSGDGGVRSRGLRVREVCVYLATGVRVAANERYGDGLRNRTEYLIRFEYKKHFFYMWRVTWEYVVRRAIDHLGEKRKA